MMRFPLRLTADLTRARLASKLRFAREAGPVQFVDVEELLHHDSSHPVSREKIGQIISSRSPVVWIGGSEPLHHPGISHLVRAIAQTGHFVFLETDGALLRRRIHEFQPVPRLFLTVRLEPDTQRSGADGLRTEVFGMAAEGVRAARLSGFLICVHAPVRASTEPGKMAELIQYVRSLDVDGMVITPVNGGSNFTNLDAEALRQKTAEARKLFESKWWESFSRLVEPVLSKQQTGTRTFDEAGKRRERESRVNDESVRVA